MFKSFKEFFTLFSTVEEEDWKKWQDETLGQAKNLSDFVALILRSSFLFLLFLYFSNASHEKDNLFSSWLLGMCAMLCLGLYFYIYFYIIKICMYHYLTDSSYHKNTIYKVWIVVLSFITVFAIGFGISNFVRAFAENSALMN